MTISVFDLFKIGIGPSSSHTVGPMWAARRFLQDLESRSLLDAVHAVRVDLFGSLAMTGHGHATDKAIMLGLAGEAPDTVAANAVDAMITDIREAGTLPLFGRRPMPFNEKEDLVFRYGELLPGHPNGIQFTARDEDGLVLLAVVYYSVGGGFVMSEDELAAGHVNPLTNVHQPYPFKTGKDLLAIGRATGLSIANIVMANEAAWRDEVETRQGLLRIWSVMDGSIQRGCREHGILPGGLKVKRRASAIFADLMGKPEAGLRDQLTILDWVNLFALAVNEENAAGGRVVTAPTNGAAGVIPAVVAYYDRFIPGSSPQGIVRMLLTAGAIGMLYKQNASISAAEVGCQGEVGVACSMAAAALAAVLGGSNEQAENAAEIGMEHNLGLTCDPIGGLVQIPCIERNTMGAVKAINAARLALRGDGTHVVGLDQVIETMRQTGMDMQTKYKETSEAGLAVNVIEC